MDKKHKLDRYSQKDYTELVDFPVEIVGRDGSVRRYSFEDSIRLYQRRVTFAAIRYRDDDLVDAEIFHCRSRIEQLRRSYFHRFGWGTADGDPDPLEVFGEVAGEIAAFLCRVLQSGGRPDVSVEPVTDLGELDAGSGYSTWFVRPHGSAVAAGASAGQGLLLYVHRFDGDDADAGREHFFGTLKVFERAGRTDGEQERLVAFHHTVDCGFVLTARAGEFEHLVAWREDDEDIADLSPTPWDQALEVIRRGRYEEGMERCRQVVEDQPWHRNAYVAGAVLASFLGHPLLAEDFALIGSRYFPEDPVLRYHIGLARVAQGRAADAVPELRLAVELAPGMVVARFLLVVTLLQGSGVPFGAGREARRVLSGRAHARADDRRADLLLERLEQWLRWRRVMVGGGALSGVLGAVAVGLGGWLGVAPAVLGVGMVVTGQLAFRRQVARLRERVRFDDVGYGLRRLQRRGGGGEPRIS